VKHILILRAAIALALLDLIIFRFSFHFNVPVFLAVFIAVSADLILAKILIARGHFK
jgi:uncharacterized membrane protein